MKTFLFWAFVFFVAVNWTEVSSFVSANAAKANKAMVQWLIENTPKPPKFPSPTKGNNE